MYDVELVLEKTPSFGPLKIRGPDEYNIYLEEVPIKHKKTTMKSTNKETTINKKS